ncbi:MAG: orotate phosphoribosyltransferase [Phycisphaerae bacterium SM23_30]|nr:MAG: orotate phosphoribosyltransferase [Phycisphaerae bacterium SM23_30]
MRRYKAEFIEFLVGAGVLTFGDFTTRSGRQTPYFINTGNYRTGGQLARLGEFYARAINEHWGRDFDNLYGPAYKGIPLAVAAGIALNAEHGHNVTVTYNRKEAKDHGERGGIIGHRYDGSERVVIIEDVITAGTSLRETMGILAENGNPQVAGVIVSVDRMERGRDSLSALEEIKAEFNFPVRAIVNVREIIVHLHNHPIKDKVYINDDMKQRMEEYLREYGVEII